MIDCGCVFLKRKNRCVAILSRPLHNNLWLWFDFLKEEDAICGSTVSYVIKYGFTVIGFSQRERNQERRSDPYVIISYRMLQGRKDQWTVLLYSLICCKIMNYCECLFLTILLYRKQNNDWHFFLEWSRNKLGFLKYCFICVHKNGVYVFQQGWATLWMWLYPLIYGDEELLSKCTVYYESDYASTDSYVIKLWSYLKKGLFNKCLVKLHLFNSNIRRVWIYNKRGNQHLLIEEG